MNKHSKLKDPQKINCIAKLQELNNRETMFANLLNSSENEYSKFATEKWYIIDSESKGNYSNESPIKFSTSSLESSLMHIF